MFQIYISMHSNSAKEYSLPPCTLKSNEIPFFHAHICALRNGSHFNYSTSLFLLFPISRNTDTKKHYFVISRSMHITKILWLLFIPLNRIQNCFTDLLLSMATCFLALTNTVFWLLKNYFFPSLPSIVGGQSLSLSVETTMILLLLLVSSNCSLVTAISKNSLLCEKSQILTFQGVIFKQDKMLNYHFFLCRIWKVGNFFSLEMMGRGVQDFQIYNLMCFRSTPSWSLWPYRSCCFGV